MSDPRAGCGRQPAGTCAIPFTDGRIRHEQPLEEKDPQARLDPDTERGRRLVGDLGWLAPDIRLILERPNVLPGGDARAARGACSRPVDITESFV